MTEVHVEYASRGKQNKISGLFPYWYISNTELQNLFFFLACTGMMKGGMWVIQKGQFSEYIWKPSERAHAEICQHHSPKHPFRVPLTYASKTLQTCLYVTKERRKEELEHWHASFPPPPFPVAVKIWIQMLIFTSTIERSFPVLSGLRRITNHPSTAIG